MTKSKERSREDRKIADLAREYLELGYEVYAQAHGFERPSPVAGTTPDLVVKKGSQTVIIEVESKGTAVARSDAIAELSQYAKTTPNVRFDLVMTNPRPSTTPSLKPGVSSRHIEQAVTRALFEEINIALREERADLATLLEATALRALLLRAGATRELRLDSRSDLRALADALMKRKVISKPVSELAASLQSYRNALAHNRPPPSLEEVKGILRKLESLNTVWR